MRKLIQDSRETLYENAQKAVQSLAFALREELSNIAYCCWGPDKRDTCILWVTEEDLQEGDGIYGNSTGMYLFECGGDMAIYLPKITEMYQEFCAATIELHENDDNLFYETVVDDIDIWYNGKGIIELVIFSNVVDLPKEVYESAKFLAEEMVKMLSGIKCFEKVEYYEGDDEGNTGFEKEHNNYFVGVKLRFNVH